MPHDDEINLIAYQETGCSWYCFLNNTQSFKTSFFQQDFSKSWKSCCNNMKVWNNKTFPWCLVFEDILTDIKYVFGSLEALSVWDFGDKQLWITVIWDRREHYENRDNANLDLWDCCLANIDLEDPLAFGLSNFLTWLKARIRHAFSTLKAWECSSTEVFTSFISHKVYETSANHTEEAVH